jgi:hypothetical protein
MVQCVHDARRVSPHSAKRQAGERHREPAIKQKPNHQKYQKFAGKTRGMTRPVCATA